MKLIISVLMSLISFSAMAASSATVGPQSSWDEIAGAGLWPNFPRLQFAGKDKNYSVPVINACVSGERIEAVSPWTSEVLLADKKSGNTTYTVPVMENFGADHGGEKVAFTKSFTLPLCD